MKVFYYKIRPDIYRKGNFGPETIYFTCCRGVVPGRLSPVWAMASASAWIIPGTEEDSENENED